MCVWLRCSGMSIHGMLIHSILPPKTKKKLSKLKKNHTNWRKKEKIVSLQAKISNMPFDQKFFWPPEMGVSQWRRQTNTQTDIAALWLNRPRGRFSGNHTFDKFLPYMCAHPALPFCHLFFSAQLTHPAVHAAGSWIIQLFTQLTTETSSCSHSWPLKHQAVHTAEYWHIKLFTQLNTETFSC